MDTTAHLSASETTNTKGHSGVLLFAARAGLLGFASEPFLLMDACAYFYMRRFLPMPLLNLMCYSYSEEET
jgi:hypothetical protein